MPRTLKIVLAYDGTDLVGWQRQAAGVSVQAHLEDALSAIEGRPVAAVGAGRTDAGVHALGQVASCRLDHPLPVARLEAALNAMLPGDIRVLEVAEVDGAFHARYGARLKTYRYLLLNSAVVNPFERRYVWHVPQPLDIGAVAAGAMSLEGEHDFAALRAAGSATKTSVRRLTAVTVRESTSAEVVGGSLALRRASGPGRIVAFEFTGTGFLRHMIRNAVGTLVEIGLGKRSPAWMAEVLASGDRARAGPTAPAHGLFLVGVVYDASLSPALRLAPLAQGTPSEVEG
jgi:tRNA pseudouridine38-40 synthase